MKKYNIIVKNGMGLMIDNRIIEALTPRNAMIKYLEKMEIYEDDTITIREVD